VGAVIAWLVLALLVRTGSSRQILLASILSGPAVLALTYFAVGGRIPRRLVARGWHPWSVIIIVAWIGMLTAIFTSMFLKP